MNIQKRGSSMALMLMLVSALTLPVNSAFARDYYNYGSRYSSGSGVGDYMHQHPYVKKAVIGGGAGAALGAILGQEGNRGGSAIKGALLGTGAGLGYEYLRQQGIISW